MHLCVYSVKIQSQWEEANHDPLQPRKMISRMETRHAREKGLIVSASAQIIKAANKPNT